MHLLELNYRRPRIVSRMVMKFISDGWLGISVVTDGYSGWSSTLHQAWKMAADAAAVILAETVTVLAGNKDFNRSDPFASDEGSTVIDDN